MQRFENLMQLKIGELLEAWGKDQAEATRQRARAAGLKSSGRLIDAIQYEVNDLETFAAITYWFTGTIIDRKIIDFENRRGGAPMQAIREWIEEKGLAAFGGYRGRKRNATRAEIITDMAWAIRRRWESDGKREGRPWNLRNPLLISADELQKQVVALYEKEILNNMTNTAQHGSK